jgi:hypothetical protein
MADLKPLGSEKLNGDDKLKRILELTYYNNNQSSTKKSELVKESTNGGVYGIVKEKDGYYVKKGLNESSLDYIGGMFMKNKNKFSSYAEAFKRLDLLKGQEDLQEATKYVLKQTKPQEESPLAEPSMDAPAAPAAPAAPDAGMGVPPAAEEPMGDMPAEEPMGELPPSGGEEMGGEGKRSDYMAEAQKYAGKLGQELRDLQDKMESDDIKYILNMVISAVDLDKLDDEDIEDIAKKFEREEEEMGGEEPIAEPSAEDEVPAEEPITGDEDLGETMDLLNSFIESPIGQEDTNELDLSKFADIEASEGQSYEDDVQELDLDEIKNDINQAISEKLSKYFK